MAEEAEVLESAASEEVQAKAKDLGWLPPKHFRGDPEKFVDADEYIRRSEEVLPFVKARNSKLESQVAKLTQQLTEQAELLKANQESMSAMEKYHQEDTKRRIESVRRQLKAAVAQASKDGDHDALADAAAQLTEFEATVKSAETEEVEAAKKKQDDAKKRAAEAAQELSPAMQSWLGENPWYGKDEDRTDFANAVAMRLRRSQRFASEADFLTAVAEGVEAQFGEASRRREDPASGGRPRGSRGGGGRTYADLPKDAKEACDSFSRQLVGKGRKYETIDAWRKKYATDYFESEQ